ncbi:hypothetical protein [Pedobacter alluvionis]|uniref:Uncharacterized protein n=1 Tax=Pedobacter alluvionis TaxID=475253 RepID=A0A497XVJ0_9SPHI|nr:hypothetical protein [Pedobacter alluvionis]RLJ73654.1 hypothetical protein BCL90_3816 [Pedobacter alluvionis]TFB32721.1 hypothetical protein E3V97_01395 [Pedobacter alluvionis]
MVNIRTDLQVPVAVPVDQDKARGTGKKCRASDTWNVGTTIKCKIQGRPAPRLRRFSKGKQSQYKGMKVLDTAKITDVGRIISFIAALAYMVMLFIGFVIYCMAAMIRMYVYYGKLDLWYPDVQKRALHRFVHDRKHSLFAVIPDAADNFIREMGTRFII